MQSPACKSCRDHLRRPISLLVYNISPPELVAAGGLRERVHALRCKSSALPWMLFKDGVRFRPKNSRQVAGTFGGSHAAECSSVYRLFAQSQAVCALDS